MKRTFCAAALTFCACSFGQANAAPVLASAANAVSINISVANAVTATALLAPVAGSAGSAYNNSANLASINQSSLLVAAILANALTSANEALTTGIVTTNAHSSLPSSATGTANIASAKLGLTTKALNAVPLISLGVSADTITSTTTAGFNSSGLYATGSSPLANLGIAGSILGLVSINGSLYSNPSPNTLVFSSSVLSILLDEQSTTQTASSISMFTNAIHLTLSNYLLDGKLLNGDIILGHSEASVTGYVPATAAPEPESWALMILGLGFVGASLRARKRSMPLAA